MDLFTTHSILHRTGFREYSPLQKIRNITVIGLGLIGGSICRAVRRFLPSHCISGVDFEPVLQQARTREMIDQGFTPDHLEKACGKSDLVFIATPITVAKQILPQIAALANPDLIVTDVCSLKAGILAEAKPLFVDGSGTFIGGHPMAGAEKPGLQHADPFLFQNALYILTPMPETPQTAMGALAAVIAAFGACMVIMEAEVHDRIAAAVSHLPQVLAVGLMNYIASKNQDNSLYLKMAAGGFRDMTRIASSPYIIWQDILRENSEKILRELDGFIAHLQQLKEALNQGDLENHFHKAAKSRLSIPTDTRGFLNPHFDISVEVEDRPGVISAIAAKLADAKINIKDIEVLKVRENEGGTLRLAFATEIIRQRAVALLRKAGFRCQER